MFCDNLHFVIFFFTINEEWIIQAHSKTDYSKLEEKDFLNSIREYVIFSTKKDLNLLDKNLNELETLEMLNNANITGEKFLEDE